MATSFSTSPSFIDSQAKHDVFLSFRGKDTRFSFTSHLHAALCRKKIETFIDDDQIKRGDELSPTLLEAIERSKIAVVIFSKNYASSPWCLDELEKIIECKNGKNQIVIPVFYNIEPSHVRRQGGTYKDSFAKHEEYFRDNPMKVQRWRKALYNAANFSGWDSSNVRLESELVEKIVEDVLQKLNHINPHIRKGLVGIRQISLVESLLCIGSGDVRIFGIWGMGGIGKTTIAEALFAGLSYKFEGCCFVSNVSEEWKNHRENDLRDKLLAEISGEKDFHISTPSISSSFFKERLRHRKLLVVLDDVSSSKQIEYLVGNKDLFGLGSRIIVTTRNKNVLDMGVDGIFKVMGLNFDDALHLFSLNAFKQDHPKEEYRHLSEKVINYAKGLPLALKVLGSFLHSKTPKEWESTLEKLKKLPNPEIYNLLRLSYEGLDREVQNIFLDIACFFNREEKCFIKTLLDGFGYSSDIGMRILEDNSLISVSKRHEIEMHDLIQEMGLEIVRQESPKEAGKRSRLWDFEEIYHVLKYNMGTDAIEGIVLDMSKIKDLQIRPQAFARMYKLRILKLYMHSYDKICNVHISECLESLPDDLSYFRWDCFPLKMLPQSFCAEKLVQLDMRHSLVERLWDGVQDLVNLTSLFLTGCMHLVELPDFSEAPKLEEVHLDYCISLRNLPSSIFTSKYLFAINLRCCRQLRHIHADMDSKSLQWLNLSGCSKLIEFSVASEKLEYLNLEGTAIEELSSSVGRLKNLSSLHLSGCRRLKLEILPPIFYAFSGSVKILCLDGCSNISKLPDNLGILSALNRLSLRGSNIETLPVSIKHLSQLRALNISDCKRLESLPELPLFLQDFNARGCTSLETLSCSGADLLQNSFGRSNKRSFLKKIKEDEEKSVCHYDYLAKFDFYNCRKLDQNAHKSIMVEAEIRIQHAAYLSSMIEARYDPYCESNQDSEDSGLENFKYTSRRVYICLPGSEVPKWFRYKATECSSTITIMIPRDWFSECMHLGVVFCLVHARSKSNKMGNNNHAFVVGCKTYLNHSYDGTYIMKYSGSDVQSDHVWLWYDKLPIRTQDRDSYFTKVSFEFFVRGSNSRFIVKQCGVQPLYAPDDIDMGQSSIGKVGNKERERLDFESKLYDSKIVKLDDGSVSYLSDELLWMEIQKFETDFGSRMSGKQSYLKLDGYFWKSLPLDFFVVENIVEVLSLRDSKIESLPASIKHLSRLKYIYLDGCKRLQSIPELPPSIEYVDASNCISLETVSYSTFGLLKKHYRNKNRSITCLFVNCMKLDEHIIDRFFRHTHLTLKEAACNYLLSITDQTEARQDFCRFDFCLRGSKVPDLFTYRTTQSINIELDSLSGLLGFVFCVVISHVHLVGPRVVLECHMENGGRIRTLHGPFLVTSMDSDHAYLWSDKSVSEEMLRTNSRKVFVRFACYREPGSPIIKEYGVCPIYASVPSHCK